MHLANLNNPDLWLGLWHGTIKSYGVDSLANWRFKVLIDNVWTGHGEMISLSSRYIPTSFGHTARDPSLKINLGYKGSEFLTYLYGLGPALL